MPDTEKMKEKFLEKMEEAGTKSAAIKAIGLTRTCLYKWLAKDPEFKAKVDEIINTSCDIIVDTVYTRARKNLISGSPHEQGVGIRAAELYLEFHGKLKKEIPVNLNGGNLKVNLSWGAEDVPDDDATDD